MSETILAPATPAEERAALLALSIGDLRIIAEKIGATNARSKENLVTNLMTRADEQGITYVGYIGALPDTSVDGESEQPEKEPKDSKNGRPEATQPLTDVPLFDPYMTTLKHFMFTVGDVAEPDMLSGLYDVTSVDETIGRYYQNGYEPSEVFVGGFDTRGHRVGWVLQRVKDARFTESHMILQTLTATADPARGTVTGFQADAYISSYLDDGWELVGVRFNGLDMGSGGVYMVWFLAR